MRDYKREYRRYHSRPEQVKRRAARNAARRALARTGRVRKGDGKDVHHRSNNPLNNSSKNLQVTSVAKNRGYPRHADNSPKRTELAGGGLAAYHYFDALTDQRTLVNTDPTEAQKKAGNYKKGHLKLHGLDLSIENPKNSWRRGKDWKTKMKNDYGYIRRTVGKDGDQVDAFIGPKRSSKTVFVIDQIDQKTGKFDEHKAMIGFGSEGEAIRSYLRNYEKGWKLGPVTPMSMDHFKTWLKGGSQRKPARGQRTMLENYIEGLYEFASRRDALKALVGLVAAPKNVKPVARVVPVTGTVARTVIPVQTGAFAKAAAFKRGMAVQKEISAETIVNKAMMKYGNKGGLGPAGKEMLKNPIVKPYLDEFYGRGSTAKQIANVSKGIATRSSGTRMTLATLKGQARDKGAVAVGGKDGRLLRMGRQPAPVMAGYPAYYSQASEATKSAHAAGKQAALKKWPMAKISPKEVRRTVSDERQREVVKRYRRRKTLRARKKSWRQNPHPIAGNPNRPVVHEFAVKPPILERLIYQLKKKGYDTGAATRIAISQQQKAGNLKRGTMQATKKGVRRGKMTPRQRAVSRGRNPRFIPKAER